jgi:hypothetical protein
VLLVTRCGGHRAGWGDGRRRALSCQHPCIGGLWSLRGDARGRGVVEEGGMGLVFFSCMERDAFETQTATGRGLTYFVAILVLCSTFNLQCNAVDGECGLRDQCASGR